jgi:CheY-like chemotaxis protein
MRRNADMTTILIIEDEAPIRDNLRQLLQLEGYAVLEAADGVSGIEVAFTSRPDLILCDILMPGVDGYGVLAELRGTPDFAAIPFVFLTASASLEDRSQALRRGADDYLIKPVKIADLLAAIKRQLEKMNNGQS